MKLLTVTAFFESHRGGVEIVAGALARALGARGLDVTWLATNATPPPQDLNARALSAWNIAERRLGFPWPLPGPRAMGAIWRAVRESDAVLAHDGLYATTIAAFLASRRFGKPFVLVQHVGEVPYRNPALRLLMRAANAVVTRPILAMADQVVFISRTTAAHFEGVRYRRPPQFIFNGVDQQVFAPGDKARARAALGLAPDARIALFVGRFVEKKGLDLLERLAAARPEVTFAFAGWGPKDPAGWGLPNVARFEGLAGESLAHLYRAADLLILPSVGEGFPLVIQEALACGLPVVCGAETVEADEAARPWLAGVDLGGEGAVRRLSDALDAVLTSHSDSEARVTFARERYAWSAAAERYDALLRRAT